MSEKKGHTLSELLLTCSNCGEYPMVIENISKYEFLGYYTITLRCKKCHSTYWKNMDAGTFEKIDFKNL